METIPDYLRRMFEATPPPRAHTLRCTCATCRVARASYQLGGIR